MVDWCTVPHGRTCAETAAFHVATTTERYRYTTSVDINNTRYKKRKKKRKGKKERIQSLIQTHMPMCAVSLLESR